MDVSLSRKVGVFAERKLKLTIRIWSSKDLKLIFVISVISFQIYIQVDSNAFIEPLESELAKQVEYDMDEQGAPTLLIPFETLNGSFQRSRMARSS